MVPKYNIPQAIPFKETLTHNNTPKQDFDKITLDDIAFLQYTGGTTGLSKGAVLTHRNISANIMQAKAWLGESLKDKQEDKQDVIITALPLYHIFSLTANCLTFMVLGGENVLIPNARDIPDFIKTLKKTPFSVITGVNTLFNALLNHSEFSEYIFVIYN